MSKQVCPSGWSAFHALFRVLPVWSGASYMHDDRGTNAHFTKIATTYGQVRTTGEEPVLYIRDQLKEFGTIEAADAECLFKWTAPKHFEGPSNVRF